MKDFRALFSCAVQLHGAGDGERAGQLYEQVLSLNPDFAPACHNLGLLAFESGRLDLARDYFERTLRLEPNNASALSDLGNVFHAIGNVEEAIGCYRRSLELNPALSEAHYSLGKAFKTQGNLDEAIHSYLRAVELRPDYAEAHNSLGNALQEVGKIADAVVNYRRAISLNRNYTAAFHNLGTALLAQENLDEAISCLNRAIELKPDLAESYNSLGNIMLSRDQVTEAIGYFHHTLALKPDFPDAHNNLGTAYRTLGKIDDAVHCFHRALELKPNYAEAHNNLGYAFLTQGKLDEATKSLRRALKLKPDYADAHNNLGNALAAQGRLDEAIVSYLRVLELEPDHADAHFNQSLALLKRGDFAAGWQQYEWRWMTGQLVERKFTQPLWDGQELEGRTVLLHAEQGFGDTFQFVRYAEIVKKQDPDATVVLECQRPLERLLARCKGVDRIVAQGDDLPPFEVHAPLLSLPGIFKTRVETIPANVPYLFANEELVRKWGERLGDVVGDAGKSTADQRFGPGEKSTAGRRPAPRDGDQVWSRLVGVNWQGRAGQGEFKRRDIPLEHFVALGEIPGVRLISLQKGADQRDFAKTGIVALGDDWDTAAGPFMDTAAIMKNLDLVITSDTSVPHLAGALGVPVWVALPFVPDWRWLLDRSDSPWHPTMRLFRQKRAGDWSEVFEELARALRQRI
jgi:tetratricopeptide (TPR) repeat protein